MKNIIRLQIFFLTFICLGNFIFAQDKTNEIVPEKWTRLETENKEFSAAFPPNFIVDAEKKSNGRRYKIFGFKPGIRMDLTIDKESDPKSRLSFLSSRANANSQSFTLKKFRGMRTFSDNEKKFLVEKLFLATDDYFYSLNIIAEDKDNPDVLKFVSTIKVSGEYIYNKKDERKDIENLVALNTLKSSPEVTEALKRKLIKKDLKPTTESDAAYTEGIDYKQYSRPPILLDQPFPSMQPTKGSNEFSAKLKVTILANGQIGNVVVIGDGDKAFIKACVEAVQKIRVIPAQIDGKNVDSPLIIAYSISFDFSTLPEILRPQF